MALSGTRGPRVVGVALGALAVLTSLLVAPAGAAPAEPADRSAAPPDPAASGVADRLARPLDWGPCDADALAPVPEADRALYSCADQLVPLDHDRPRGERISIALMRRAAEDPGRRIGSLVVNPGGPGSPGRLLAATIADRVDDRVLDAFDIVGFDPRGVGGSTRIECFTDASDAIDVFAGQLAIPITDEEVAGTLNAFARYGDFCARNAGPLLAHMATRDVAHDLEWLRAGLGERRLNYLGQSYGTLLGATYANLYPHRVRAMVFDSAVDPQLRTNDGLQQDRERAAGFEASLDAFLAECQQVGDACAFGTGDPRAKFAELRDHLRQQPIRLPDGTELDINSFTTGAAYGLFFSAALPGLAAEFQAAYDVLHPPADPPAPTAADFPLLRAGGQAAGFTGADGVDGTDGAAGAVEENPYRDYDPHFAVNCSDKPYAHEQRDVPGIVAEWETESPTFARFQAFAEEAACPVWPAASPDRYSGPWDRETRHPVLVLGGLHDPATPYAFSRRMTEQLGNARLLTMDGYGHGLLGLSTEADAAIADYLIRLRVPAPGTVVEPDLPLFPG
ncbi:alpha/beta hydrolase [Streptomyces sp. DSM 44915]|uniref:Alpha/beta hydrolase n=1 Tax=Streptomyces chisholmiae TaxID=3075540 RepID=A0ABU2JSV8_9ACTN|nr:alpha/beta hydrolase [Streptomyces sp. DSM 44915]MDT0268055.1 alpha/beta hydrolase [Streptomyces sp. DSM 44915]